MLYFNRVVQSARMTPLSREALLKNININSVNILDIKRYKNEMSMSMVFSDEAVLEIAAKLLRGGQGGKLPYGFKVKGAS